MQFGSQDEGRCHDQGGQDQADHHSVARPVNFGNQLFNVTVFDLNSQVVVGEFFQRPAE